DDEVWAQVAFLRAMPRMSAETYAGMAFGDATPEEMLEGPGDSTVETALADCARCHGRDGLGRGPGAAGAAFPVIAGQPEAYLYQTLLAFRDGMRGSGFMEPPARRYDRATLRALAAHYAGQPRPAGARAVPQRPTLEAEEPTVIRQDDAGRLEGDGSVSGLVPRSAA